MKLQDWLKTELTTQIYKFKDMMTDKYIAPEVLVVECEVEKGFAVSLGIGGEVEDVIVDI